ncbi:MAG TPA: HEAT repeat domain-containing protein, partial [Blastocatellia bacterium]|nr:HEAT repeat domain-containing protein [Blastocatellia bacterium]
LRSAKEPTDAVTKRIAELARQAPEVVLDMLTDYDLNVRAASIAAFGRLSDARVNEVLVWALNDKDAFCSNVAAQALSERGTAGLTALKNNLSKLDSSALLRVAAWLNDATARELAEELCQSDKAAQQLAGLRLAIAFPLAGVRLPYAKLFTTDDVHVIGHAMEAIRLRRPTAEVAELRKMIGTETELWAIHALGELASSDITAQLEERQKAVGARYDKLLASKGVITVKGTSSAPPPPPPMPKGSGAKKSKPLTGVPGGIPGGVPAEAPVIAGYANSSSPAATPPALFKAETELTRLWSVVIELEDALTKIKLRDRWDKAQDEPTRRAIRADANKNDRLKQWASVTLQTVSTPALAFSVDLAKLKNAPATGETLFPSNATLYLTAPNFEQTIHQLDSALSGIQMGTVRDQMTFALMLNSIKAQLTNKMNVNVTGSASQTLGIDLKAPISLATWPREQGSFSAIANSAVVMRVTDRVRFERTLTMYQTDFGGFASFAPAVSIGARVASITPAVMPVMFYAISAVSDLAGTITSTSKSQPGGASFAGGSSVFVRQEKWGELPITVFEKLGYVGIDATNQERIYLAYLGDTAVLAPSRAALLDVLKTDKPTITANPSYARIKAEKGEIVFFSQFDAVLKNLIEEVRGEAADAKGKDPFDAVVTDAIIKALGAETGAVRLSQSDWDSVFHLALGENDFVKILRPFQAADLSAPRDLLPKQMLLYAATVIDPEKFVEYGKKWDAELAKSKSSTEKKDAEKTKEDAKFNRIFSGLQTLLVPHLQGEVSAALVNVSSLL